MDNREVDFKLHEKAGLCYLGLNEDQEIQWIGTDKEWEKYEELTEFLDYPLSPGKEIIKKEIIEPRFGIKID